MIKHVIIDLIILIFIFDFSFAKTMTQQLFIVSTDSSQKSSPGLIENSNQEHKKYIQGSSKGNCDKDLLKGIIYTRIGENGESSQYRIRFAPYQLSPEHAKAFNEIRAQHVKIYGENNGARDYEQRVCRYYFGSYSYVNLPDGVEALDHLLNKCPMKELKDIVLADNGPWRDCAPGVVECKPQSTKALQHPLNKIPCGRKLP